MMFSSGLIVECAASHIFSHGPHHFTSRYAGDRQCGRTGSGRGAGERICGAAAGVSWYVFARFRWLRQGSLEPRATSLIALIASRPSAPYVSRPGPARPCGQRTRGARWTRVYCLLTVLGVSQRANSLTVARFVVFSLGAGFRVSKWLGCRALTVCVSLCSVVFAHWGGPLHGGAGGKERMSSIDTHGASTCGSACSCKRGAQSRAVASGWRNWPTTGRPARDIAARCAVLAGARGYFCWGYRRVPIARGDLVCMCGLAHTPHTFVGQASARLYIYIYILIIIVDRL